MSAFTVARKHLARVLLSNSLRPMGPATLPAASRSYNKYNTEDPFYNPFYVVCGPCPTSQTPSFPPLHHEYLVRNLGDGFHVRLYMPGVGKGNVKVWIEGHELIAEGIKDKDFENEDDTTNTLLRYRMLGPDDEHFNLSAIEAEINDGMLRVFVPRRDPNRFVPRDQRGDVLSVLKGWFRSWFSK
ncbi:hypothetical protein CASFOL_008443 [Castilleja foliolosa]|uniref:SHSP domain-containing protein n=1 Tax=Castilleja foliolosa TaxID=1961234 RepID=A0ABD3DZ00_9LAMI